MALRLTRFEFERLQARRKRGAIGPPENPFNRIWKRHRWEMEFDAQLCGARISGWQREYRFQEDRRFRFDFAWVADRFAVEIDGAVHRIKKRYQGDQEKGQLALLGSWRVLHVTPLQVRNGEALSLVKKLLKIAGAV